MVTTIQIRENIKRELDKLKGSEKETYEEVIINLMRTTEEHKRKHKKLLSEGYKEMARESLIINKDWSVADKDWD